MSRDLLAEKYRALTAAGQAALEFARAHNEFWAAVDDLCAANRALADLPRAEGGNDE